VAARLALHRRPSACHPQELQKLDEDFAKRLALSQLTERRGPEHTATLLESKGMSKATVERALNYASEVRVWGTGSARRGCSKRFPTLTLTAGDRTAQHGWQPGHAMMREGGTHTERRAAREWAPWAARAV